MMTQIVSITLSAITAALTAIPVDVAHHHCPEDYADPLCVPKGAVEEVANRSEFPDKRCAPGPNGGVVCTG